MILECPADGERCDRFFVLRQLVRHDDRAAGGEHAADSERRLLAWWRHRAPGELAVHGVRRQVWAVRPADGTELVDRHLVEHCLVAQGLKDLAVELAGEVDRARDPVVELDVEPVLGKRADLYDTGHH
jgi:hypothetical protein